MPGQPGIDTPALICDLESGVQRGKSNHSDEHQHETHMHSAS